MNRWTPVLDAALIESRASGETQHAFAVRQGLTFESVASRVHRLTKLGCIGLKNPIRWANGGNDKLRELFASGASDLEIAAAFGVAPPAVRKQLSRIGLKRPRREQIPRRAREARIRARREPKPERWTGTKISRLMELIDLGWSQQLIADDLGVPKSAVSSRTVKLRRAGYLIPTRFPTVRPPRVYVDLAAHMSRVPLETLERHIIAPGFEKHLEPLLLYRGNLPLGRVHRLWNFTKAMMLQGADTIADATQRLSMNPDFSHLCGPNTRVTNRSLEGFWSRVLATPRIHGEDPELIEFIREMNFWRRNLEPLSEIVHDPRVRWIGEYRTYIPTARKSRDHKGRPAREPKHQDLVYPFLIHNGGGPEHELLREINRVVPKYLPPDMRADVCQDLIVGILCGDFARDDLNLPLKEVLKRVRKMYPSKWGDISLDSIVPGTDDLRLIDTIGDDRGLWQ